MRARRLLTRRCCFLRREESGTLKAQRTVATKTDKILAFDHWVLIPEDVSMTWSVQILRAVSFSRSSMGKNAKKIATEASGGP